MVRVILLEDERPDQVLFKNVLKDLEFSGDFYITENIDTLIKLILKIKKTASVKDINILFLDMVLPGEMGTEAVCKIQYDELPGTNFCFFLSGHTSETVVKEAYQLGVNGYIFKPTIYSQLFSLVKSILSFCMCSV